MFINLSIQNLCAGINSLYRSFLLSWKRKLRKKQGKNIAFLTKDGTSYIKNMPNIVFLLKKKIPKNWWRSCTV